MTDNILIGGPEVRGKTSHPPRRAQRIPESKEDNQMTPSRKQLCPCGTGKKFKHCCGKHVIPHARASNAVTMPDGTNMPIPTALQAAMQLHQAGRFRQAGAIYRRMLDIQPQHVDALHLLGVVEYQLTNYPQAVNLIRKAIEISPNVGMYYNNFGKVLFALGRVNEAVEQYSKALSLQPNFPEAHYNLGEALCASNRLDEAASCIEQLLEYKPDFYDAYSTLAEILSRKGETEKTLARCQKALTTYPDNAILICCVGGALRKLGKIDEAIAHYQHALDIKPDFAEAHHNLGNAFAIQGKVEMAIAHYEQALALTPSFSDSNSAILMALNYISGKDSATIYAAHLEFAKRYEVPLAKFVKPHPNNRSLCRRLRVGYVSSDFRQHAVAHFIAPVLEHHNHDQVQVFCYSNHYVEDEVTRRMQTYAECWRRIFGLSDHQVAQQIRHDRIDILIDLGGHSGGYDRLRVFARKPAPIQVTWLGYPNTTGLSAMDYRITDEYADPIGLTDAFHTEQLIRLPGTFACFDLLHDCPDVTELPARQNEYITFGSFNNFSKVTPEVIMLWAKILQSVPSARLILKNKILDGAVGRRSTLEAFAAHGISGKQLELVGHSKSQIDHLEWYNKIDIGLDTFPYNGTTTTCDALWMGVPVVTLAGNKHVARVGVSQMTNIGMPELIAATPEEYLAIALRLANDLDALGKVRKDLRSRMSASPLTNASLFTRNLEQVYREMWEKWCRKHVAA